MIIKHITNDELYHHGVKGQKWGVRHGPPYPIEDKIMPKGTRINSVRALSDTDAMYVATGMANVAEILKNRPNWLYTYNANNKWDKKVYKGPFALYDARRRGANKVAEMKYEVIKDLKMPTKKERIDEFKSLYEDKKFKKTVIKDLKNTTKLLVQYKVGNEKEQAEYNDIYKKLDNLQTEEDWRIAYSVFNHTMENMHAHKSTSEYGKRMSKKYDAMVDDNNQGVYNRAQDPVIIFRANEALKTIGQELIPASEIYKNHDDVEEVLKKYGERVKL